MLKSQRRVELGRSEEAGRRSWTPGNPITELARVYAASLRFPTGSSKARANPSRDTVFHSVESQDQELFLAALPIPQKNSSQESMRLIVCLSGVVIRSLSC